MAFLFIIRSWFKSLVSVKTSPKAILENIKDQGFHGVYSCLQPAGTGSYWHSYLPIELAKWLKKYITKEFDHSYRILNAFLVISKQVVRNLIKNYTSKQALMF